MRNARRFFPPLFVGACLFVAGETFAQTPPGNGAVPGTGTGSGGTGTGGTGTGTGTGGTGTGTGTGSGSGASSGSTRGGSGSGSGASRFERRDIGRRSLGEESQNTDFVGADSGDTIGVRGGEDAEGTAGGAGGAGGLGGSSGLGGFFNQIFGGDGTGGLPSQGGQGSRPSVRVRLSPAIEYFDETGAGLADPHIARVDARLAGAMNRYRGNRHLGSLQNVSIAFDDRTAVLTGQVDSARQKRLLEGMLLMEPGIGTVENLLTVRQAAPTSPPVFDPTQASVVE